MNELLWGPKSLGWLSVISANQVHIVLHRKSLWRRVRNSHRCEASGGDKQIHCVLIPTFDCSERWIGGRFSFQLVNAMSHKTLAWIPGKSGSVNRTFVIVIYYLQQSPESNSVNLWRKWLQQLQSRSNVVCLRKQSNVVRLQTMQDFHPWELKHYACVF